MENLIFSSGELELLHSALGHSIDRCVEHSYGFEETEEYEKHEELRRKIRVFLVNTGKYEVWFGDTLRLIPSKKDEN